jgi:hypothetical protein
VAWCWCVIVIRGLWPNNVSEGLAYVAHIREIILSMADFITSRRSMVRCRQYVHQYVLHDGTHDFLLMSR